VRWKFKFYICTNETNVSFQRVKELAQYSTIWFITFSPHKPHCMFLVWS